MKIVVCIKQVPDTKGGVKFNPDGTLDRGAMLAIMNPDDKAGLEAALKLKDEFGAEVTVLTMGLPKAADALREALAMGADKAILVTDRVLGGADTWATSTTIAGALRNLDYDLIITGRQAIDGDTAQVGPQIAEHLGLPVISYAQDIKVEGDKVIVQRQYDDRYHHIPRGYTGRYLWRPAVRTMWFTMAVGYVKRFNLLKNAAWQLLIMSGICVLWDLGTGWRDGR